MNLKALPGFRDFYPEDAALRSRIFAVWRDVARTFGFEEYDGPPLEPLDLYTAKSGDEIVAQLYSFVDKGGREVALRPEMTPTLARMVAARATGLKKPIRWFSTPQLFRYERQQRGRLREHFQLNMDLLGAEGPAADAEIVAAALEVLIRLGFGPDQVKARISHRGVVKLLLEKFGVAGPEAGVALQAIDKLGRIPHEALREMLAQNGMTASVIDQILGIGSLSSSERLGELLGDQPCVSDLIECVEVLSQLGYGEYLEIDLSVVRGLAYYTGMVFELFDARKELRAICGGGRYDGLLKQLGGVDLPGLGFGMGDVVLTELLKTQGTPPPTPKLDVFAVAVGGEDVSEMLGLVTTLRRAGLAVEYALRTQSVGKQLKLAAARGARYAMIIGPDERAGRFANVRNLIDGTERKIDFSELPDANNWH